MKNRYLEHAHIDERTFRRILHCFCLNIEANKVAAITRISRQSINKLFSCFRYRIATICEEETTYSEGEFELDESYFGAHIEGVELKGKLLYLGY